MTDILIVEDNVELAGLLKDFLTMDGYMTDVCNNGEDAVDYVKANGAKLVILDIMLPGMDGFSVCREIRENLNIPIIIVSAKSEKEDKLTGLKLGADDYIEKPYDIDILRAKIKAIYSRNCIDDNVNLVVGNVTINPLKHEVMLDDKVVPMNVKEYDLLYFLMTNRGKVLNKNLIFDTVWGADSYSEPSTLTVHIKWLREKLEKDAKNPEKIITVWGIGYKYEG